MLGITPLSISNRSKSPSFQSMTKESIDSDIKFYKDQVDEIDQFLNEDYVPQKVKKPLKFFRTIANGAIDGLAVFGSTMMLSGFVRKSGAKLTANQNIQKLTQKAKPIIDLVPKAFSKIGDFFSKGLDKLVKTDTYQKFLSTKIGKKVMTNVALLFAKSEELADKLTKPIKNINTDKVTKGAATFLGIGSGVTGAYETAIENDKQVAVEDIDEEVKEVA